MTTTNNNNNNTNKSINIVEEDSDLKSSPLLLVSIHNDNGNHDDGHNINDNDEEVGRWNATTTTTCKKNRSSSSQSSAPTFLSKIMKHHIACVNHLWHTMVNDWTVTVYVGLIIVSFIICYALSILVTITTTAAASNSNNTKVQQHQEQQQPSQNANVTFTLDIIFLLWTGGSFVVCLFALVGIFTNDARKVIPAIVLYLVQGLLILADDNQNWCSAILWLSSMYLMALWSYMIRRHQGQDQQ